MDDIGKAYRHFKKVDSVLYKAGLPFRRSLVYWDAKPNSNAWLFTRLCRSVMAQQLATKAAASIRARVEEACGGKITPKSVRKTPPPKLRKAGLSGAKIKTIKEIAKAVDKGLSLKSLHGKTPKEAEETLTAIWGVGPWTAEMFLMFALNHPDIFSSRDLGLVRSMETLYKLPKNTKQEKLEKLAERWSPYRTYACLILWRSRDQAKKS